MRTDLGNGLRFVSLLLIVCCYALSLNPLCFSILFLIIISKKIDFFILFCGSLGGSNATYSEGFTARGRSSQVFVLGLVGFDVVVPTCSVGI